jgi:hypothetical protein
MGYGIREETKTRETGNTPCRKKADVGRRRRG